LEVERLGVTAIRRAELKKELAAHPAVAARKRVPVDAWAEFAGDELAEASGA
jgi:hypothetical protein